MPFAEYSDFKDCVNKNRDKGDPEAYCAAIQQAVEGKTKTFRTYSFHTDQIQAHPVYLKGKKRYYVTGYISTSEVDLYNDLVTKEAMDDMIKQIRETDIMLDYDHEAWRDSSTLIPVGKIVEAHVDDRGLWVKAELNPASPKFKDMWDSITGGFIKAFSIAFKPVRTVMRLMGSTRVRLLQQVKLLNVALTGVPVNQGATLDDYSMKGIMLKAITEVGEYEQKTKLEENKMSEEENKVDAVVKDHTPEVSVEQKAGMEDGKDYKKGYKAGYSAGRHDMREENKAGKDPYKNGKKAQGEDEEKKKMHEEKSEDKLDSLLAEMKSMQKRIEAQETELKSLNDEGVFKAKAPELAEIKSTPAPSMLGMIQ